MKTNKYSIGQNVIVIADRKIVQKTVATIDGEGEEISYGLKNKPVEKKKNVVTGRSIVDRMDHAWTREYFGSPSVQFISNGRAVRSERSFAHYNPSYMIVDDLDTDDEDYLESEIFADEQDFRANVIIQFPAPTEAELVEAAKDRFEQQTGIELSDYPEFVSLIKK